MRVLNWCTRSVCLVILMLTCAKLSIAVPILVPTALNPGDQYMLAFVSSTTRDGTSSDIADYDTHVQNAANAQGGGLENMTWNAIASTSSVDAKDNVGNFGNLPVYLLNGTTKIADSFSDLFDGSIDSALGIDETGASLLGVNVWTGSDAFGVFSALGGGLGIGGAAEVGLSSATSSSWLALGQMGISTNSNPLYALSDVQTVAAIPEPSTLALFAVGIVSTIGLGVLRSRRLLRQKT